VPFYISNAVTISANLTAYTIWRSAIALPHFLSLPLQRIALLVRRHLRCRYPSVCGDRIRPPARPLHCLSVPQQRRLNRPTNLYEIWCRCFYVTSRKSEFRDNRLSGSRGKGRGPQDAHHCTTRNDPAAVLSFVKKSSLAMLYLTAFLTYLPHLKVGKINAVRFENDAKHSDN